PTLQKMEQMRRYYEQVIPLTRERAVEGDKALAVINLRKALAKVKEDMATRRKELKPELEKAMKESARIAEASTVDGMREQIAFKTKLAGFVEKDVERLHKESQQFTVKALDLIDFQRDLEEQEEIHRALRRRANAIELELEAPKRVRKIQDA